MNPYIGDPQGGHYAHLAQGPKKDLGIVDEVFHDWVVGGIYGIRVILHGPKGPCMPRDPLGTLRQESLSPFIAGRLGGYRSPQRVTRSVA